MGAVGRLNECSMDVSMSSWMSQWVQLDVSIGAVGCLNGCSWTSQWLDVSMSAVGRLNGSQ